MAQGGRIRRGVGGLDGRHCRIASHIVRGVGTVAVARTAPGGPVAQWLEPAAHNGLVPGSSPGRPTIAGMYITNSGYPCTSLLAPLESFFGGHDLAVWPPKYGLLGPCLDDSVKELTGQRFPLRA
jgi:hypothetical protein